MRTLRIIASMGKYTLGSKQKPLIFGKKYVFKLGKPHGFFFPPWLELRHHLFV